MSYNTYQRLSTKTFFITLLQNSINSITISFVWLGIVFLKTIKMESIFASTNDSGQIIIFITRILDLIIVVGIVVVIISWLIAIIRTLIKHLTFYFMLDEQGISIKQGLLHKNETTTPYRHIENVDIDQPLLYRMWGMCRLHIIIGAEDGGNDHQHISEIEFPFMEKITADNIRTEIFSRTNGALVGSNTISN